MRTCLAARISHAHLSRQAQTPMRGSSTATTPIAAPIDARTAPPLSLRPAAGDGAYSRQYPPYSPLPTGAPGSAPSLPSPGTTMPLTPGTPGGIPSLMTPVGVTKISAEQGLERLEQVCVCACVRACVRACVLACAFPRACATPFSSLCPSPPPIPFLLLHLAALGGLEDCT